MSRLYSYQECLVIVLAETPEAGSLPDGWGKVNTTPYHSRGWPVSEYSIARWNERIANRNSPGVRDIDVFRKWPKTVAEYAAMMNDEQQHVRFTRNGDADAVQVCIPCYPLLVTLLTDQPSLRNLRAMWTTVYILPSMLWHHPQLWCERMVSCIESRHNQCRGLCTC